MADPISIAAGALAFAEVALQGLQILITARNAGEEAKSLKAELIRSKVILDMVKACLESRSKTSFNRPSELVHKSLEVTTSTLQEAAICFKSLEEEMKTKITSQDSGMQDFKVKRFQWLRRKGHLYEMLAELQRQRQALICSIQAIFIADSYNFQFGLSRTGLLPAIDQHTLPNTFNGELESERIVSGKFNTERSYDSSQGTGRSAILRYNRESINSSVTSLASSTTLTSGDGVQYCPRCQTRHYICEPIKRLRATLMLGSFVLEGNASWISYAAERSTNHHSASRSCSATLYMAPWAWQRFIHMQFVTRPLVGARLAFRVPRIIEMASPAMQCASFGNVQGLKLLFQKGLSSPMDECVVEFDPPRRSLISQAIFMLDLHSEAQQINVIWFLIKAGADITHEYCQLNALKALQEGRVETEEGLYLLRHILNSSDVFDGCLNLLQRLVLGLNDAETTLERELQRSNFSTISEVDNLSWTVLDYAIVRGDIKLLRMLLAHGIHPRLSARWQVHGSWHYGKSAMLNQHDIFTELVVHGAVIEPEILIAVMSSASEETIRLLVEAGVNIHAENQYGWTALHAALSYDHVAAAQILLFNNASLMATAKDGKTALHFAAIHGSTEGISLLLDHGAQVNAKDKMGITSLHYAASLNMLAAVRLLISRGADTTLLTYNTLETPLQYATAGHERPRISNYGINSVHYLLHVKSEQKDGGNLEPRPFDYAKNHSDSEFVTSCVVAFLSHDVVLSCQHMLKAIETRNFRALKLLLVRKDLYDLDMFLDDQERVFEAAAQHADSNILGLLQMESWTGCSAWFGTMKRKTRYQDASFFLVTNWTLNDDGIREAFETLHTKIENVAFNEDFGEIERTINRVRENQDSGQCRSTFQEILKDFDAQDAMIFRSSPNGLWNLRHRKGYCIVDPYELEQRCSCSTKEVSPFEVNIHPLTPVKNCTHISHVTDLHASWLKCGCGLFVYHSNSSSLARRMRNCKGCGKSVYDDLCTCSL
ncbi:hypothetical protein FH972_025921 [Carpinus fangiana]|uniref:Uncharacterized protein n=1 Tax=Carpinus fangiana TaxID=176857 RepID=A0A5N6L2E9_9ROSI|nr:hypothetical protein FH972_025921 [Carpinus fangiana]